MKRKVSINCTSLLTACLVSVLAVYSAGCGKKKRNNDMYKESTASDLTLYKSKDTIYSPRGGSPHGDFKLKFNSVARAKFDASGKLPQNEVFDDGSIVVKEVYKNGQLDLYAVMKKDPSSRFASNKWIWAEYKPDGGVIYDISKRGEACTGCHLESPNRDLIRSFDLH